MQQRQEASQISRGKKPARNRTGVREPCGFDGLRDLGPRNVHSLARCIRLANLHTHSFNGLEQSTLMRIWHEFLFDTILPRQRRTISDLS
jgi:hypothetical protein